MPNNRYLDVLNLFIFLILYAFVSCSAENLPKYTPQIYINVKDFGAKGDGITDDTETLQRVLNRGNGKTIFFPQGNYLISKSLIVASGTELLGEGDVGGISGTSILPKNGVGNYATFTAEKNVLSDVIFRNIRTLKTKYALSINVNGGYMTKVKWYNCVFQEHEICINIVGTNKSGMYANIIRDSYFKRSGIGIYCTGPFNINIIQACGFENMKNGYIKLDNASLSNLSNSFIENRCESVTNKSGVAISLSKNTFGFYIERNFFENSFSNIFESNGAKNISFSNNLITNSNPNSSAFIFLNGGNAAVKNNTSLTGLLLKISDNGFYSQVTSNSFLNFSLEVKKSDLGIVNNSYNSKFNKQ